MADIVTFVVATAHAVAARSADIAIAIATETVATDIATRAATT